jgi:hypothetical protein
MTARGFLNMLLAVGGVVGGKVGVENIESSDNLDDTNDPVGGKDEKEAADGGGNGGLALAEFFRLAGIKYDGEAAKEQEGEENEASNDVDVENDGVGDGGENGEGFGDGVTAGEGAAAVFATDIDFGEDS